MSSPAGDIADYLEIQGVGTVGTNIFAHLEPNKPNTCVTVLDTTGLQPLEIGENLRQPGIQIRVRAVDYESAYSLHNTIVRLLCVDVTEFSSASHRYVGCWQQGDIFNLGRDQNDRFVTTSNYLLIRHEVQS